MRQVDDLVSAPGAVDEQLDIGELAEVSSRAIPR